MSYINVCCSSVMSDDEDSEVFEKYTIIEVNQIARVVIDGVPESNHDVEKADRALEKKLTMKNLLS